jgi:hypothetical protein
MSIGQFGRNLVMRSKLLFLFIFSILSNAFLQTALATTSNLHWGVIEGDRFEYIFNVYTTDNEGELVDEIHEGVFLEVDSLPSLPEEATEAYFTPTSFYWANDSPAYLPYYFDVGGQIHGMPWVAIAIGDWTMYTDYVEVMGDFYLSGETAVIQNLFHWGIERSYSSGSYNVSYTQTWYRSDGSLEESHWLFESIYGELDVSLIRFGGPSEGLILYAIGVAAIAAVLVIIVVVRRRR